MCDVRGGGGENDRASAELTADPRGGVRRSHGDLIRSRRKRCVVRLPNGVESICTARSTRENQSWLSFNQPRRL
jgi:hypothetical protein